MTYALRDGISALVDGSRSRLGRDRIYRFCISQNNAGPVENNPEQASPNDEANPARPERDAELKVKGK
jgi:hypothetical protein